MPVVDLIPQATISNSGFTIVGAATAYEAIDEDPSTADSGDRIHTAAETGGDIVVGVNPAPSDFFSVNSIHYHIAGDLSSLTDDTINISMSLFNAGSTVQIAETETIGGSASGSFETAYGPQSALNTDPANWTTQPEFHISVTYSKNMGGDGGFAQVYAIRVLLDYSPAVFDTNEVEIPSVARRIAPVVF